VNEKPHLDAQRLARAHEVEVIRDVQVERWSGRKSRCGPTDRSRVVEDVIVAVAVPGASVNVVGEADIERAIPAVGRPNLQMGFTAAR
jgi:hypothetical protein